MTALKTIGQVILCIIFGLALTFFIGATHQAIIAALS